MPELPEVETTVRGLVPVLEGRRLVRVEAQRADLRRAFPPDLRQRLTGATVTGLSRRAKYGLIETDRGDTMVFHLGMSGRWRIDPAELGAHDHLLLETDAGRTVALNDPRRFGSVDLVRSDALEAWPTFAAMGPEPLGDGFTADTLLQALGGRSAPIKALLLDQRIVAGLGNIYVCEALHLAKIAAASRATGSSGSSRRSRRCWRRRSRRGARRCAIMRGRRASSAISPNSGASMGGKGRPASAARRFAGAPTRAARPFSALAASDPELTSAPCFSRARRERVRHLSRALFI